MQYGLKTNSLGEIRMGADAYGIAIECNGTTMDALWETPVIVTSASPTVDTEESADGRYLVVSGFFATYIFDLIDLTISLFRATIRNRHGICLEENPILGTDVRHFNGVSGNHYYIQFPFVSSDEFNGTLQKYERKRLIQISELRKNKATESP